MPYVRAVAMKIAHAPALSVRFIKRAVQQGLRNDLRTNLDLISSHYAVVTAAPDHREAVEAFIAKRKPVFE
jgi:enoyl-CoA hydratase/carnithine racemase